MEEICMKKKEYRYKMITLCGSTRFKDTFMKAAQYLSLQGWIVLNLELFSKADHLPKLSDECMEMISDKHFEKILRSDAIFVINVEGYIGEDTKKEIAFAMKHRKEVMYWEPIDGRVRLAGNTILIEPVTEKGRYKTNESL